MNEINTLEIMLFNTLGFIAALLFVIASKKYIDRSLRKHQYLTLEELLYIAEQKFTYESSRSFTHFVYGIKDSVQGNEMIPYTEKSRYGKYYKAGYNLGNDFQQLTKDQLLEFFKNIQHG